MKDWIMEVCPDIAEWQAEVIAVQFRIGVEAEREACAAEIAAQRNANEPTARQQEWWSDRMAALNAAVQDEREACAVLVERGVGDFLLGKRVANAIRARGEE